MLSVRRRFIFFFAAAVLVWPQFRAHAQDARCGLTQDCLDAVDEAPVCVAWYDDLSAEVDRISSLLLGASDVADSVNVQILPWVRTWGVTMQNPLGGFLIGLERRVLEVMTNEHEMAFLIAHEIVHAQKDHGALRQKFFNFQDSLLNSFSAAPIGVSALLALQADFANSRNQFLLTQETEADCRAAALMEAAGFDSSQSPMFFRRIADLRWSEKTNAPLDSRYEIVIDESALTHGSLLTRLQRVERCSQAAQRTLAQPGL
ncbi:MAG: M48 family metalloprotease [Elusimicrobia bacterium]|nr:M48 family metalloprotease [Elusimicrobiota bacterium]